MTAEKAAIFTLLVEAQKEELSRKLSGTKQQALEQMAQSDSGLAGSDNSLLSRSSPALESTEQKLGRAFRGQIDGSVYYRVAQEGTEAARAYGYGLNTVQPSGDSGSGRRHACIRRASQSRD